MFIILFYHSIKDSFLFFFLLSPPFSISSKFSFWNIILINISIDIKSSIFIFIIIILEVLLVSVGHFITPFVVDIHRLIKSWFLSNTITNCFTKIDFSHITEYILSICNTLNCQSLTLYVFNSGVFTLDTEYLSLSLCATFLPVKVVVNSNNKSILVLLI